MHNGFVQRRQREDVQEPGQLLHHPRRAARSTTPRRLRFFLVRTHYRSPLNYSDVHLDDARNSLKRLYTALDRVAPARRSRSTGRSRTRRASRPRWTRTSARPRRWPCCSTWPAKSTARARAELAGLLQGAGRHAGPAAGRPAGLPAGRQRARRRGHPGADRRSAPRPRPRRTSPKPTAFASELLAQGIVLKDSPTGTTWASAQ